MIEISGAESITHGSDQARLTMTREDLIRSAPDIVIVTTASEISERDREHIRASLGELPRPAFLTLDPQRIWLHGAPEAALQLRALVEPLAAERTPGPG